MDLEERARGVLAAAAGRALAALEGALEEPECFLRRDDSRQLDTKALKDTVAALRELADLVREFSGNQERQLRVVFEAGEECWNE